MKAKKAIPLTLGTLLGVAVLFALMGTAGVATWEYSNSDAFCTEACHNVHPENAFAHKASQHAEVACVECHVGRVSAFPKMVRKTGHMSHVWSVIFGYERPLTAPSMPPTRESCEGCHTTTPHPHNSIRVNRHFAANARNTETKVILLVRAVGRTFHGGQGKGIDEHTRTTVRFIANDPLKQDIPWVEATRPDGTVVVYEDASARLDEAEINAAEKHT
ncbi:MAG: NapC/NirT family cytochrome c, partial [Woeseiaceae bacterium]